LTPSSSIERLKTGSPAIRESPDLPRTQTSTEATEAGLEKTEMEFVDLIEYLDSLKKKECNRQDNV